MCNKVLALRYSCDSDASGRYLRRHALPAYRASAEPVYRSGMTLISDSGSVAELCRRLSTEPHVCVDTEFMRDRTYYPRLCWGSMSSLPAPAMPQ